VPTRAARLLLLAAAAVALWAGWREFWFLCDDAFIEFRYVANAHAGLGFVWNPPPWRPVEGYTSFLWVALLEAVWSLFGAEPPAAAPLLSLGFSYVSLGLVAWMALHLPLSGALARHRTAVLGAVLFATLSNRTFLAWTSSGLETALFSAVVLAWVAAVVVAESAPLLLVSTLAGVMALTRPDGLLYAAATAAILAVRALPGPAPRPSRGALALAAAPLLLPLAHVAWRLRTYGYLLPNTYYAKHVGPWPLAGVGYLTSFLLEYAYWVWLGVAGAAGVSALRRLHAAGTAALRPAPLLALPRVSVTRWIGIATVFAHFAYYTFDVGGDHFEYRPYHALVPLLALSFFALGDRLAWPARRTWVAFGAMTALGLVLPWTHWWHTRATVGHKEPGSFVYPIADHMIWPLRPYAAAWDAVQGRLLHHFIGIRHQGHRTYLAYQATRYPSRAEGSALPAADYPVLAASAVGYPAWNMPNVAILDRLGLNDLVVARTPPLHTEQTRRRMAHDREAPEAYVACFRPNVKIGAKGHARIVPRAVPLTAEEIRACEDTWMKRVGAE
jgi:arabinofuranosyltransferase